MDENASGEGERDKVSHRKGCWEIEGRVVIVGVHIELVVGCQDPSDVVLIAEPVVEYVGGDGEMGEMPCLSRRGQ